MITRAATEADVAAVATTIMLAFLDDPVWGTALARRDGTTTHLHAYWRLHVEGAVRHSTVFLADDAAAVAVWVPPGAAELSAEQQAALAELADANLPPSAVHALHELWSRFEANHPQREPHAYLSLLATHPDHRGSGLGQRLLADGLRRFDELGVGAFLESTNPANDHRYERAGFGRIGGFYAVANNAPISTMWRPPTTS